MITPEKIKEIRFKNNNMSQQELAEKLGVTKQYISDLERGKSPININFEKKLLQAGISILEENKLDFASEQLSISQESLKQIIETIKNEPVLMMYAAEAIKGNKTSRERFYKLTE